ncbi:MAG TPA: hypothetical protein VK487_08655 [Candidatus Bathyarchaeia archaeon]|nr:hypothetical protein [Candidatus Bathyarchaeia archaeon]
MELNLTYNANIFPLLKHEDLPVYRYKADVSPQPTNRPQLYQILGNVAKQVTRGERKPVVCFEQQIESLAYPVSKTKDFIVTIPEVGKFSVDLNEAGKSVVGIEQFDEYKHLVNRLADIALTVFSDQYYKFHPKAPFILRDEPYFDADLIESTGIIDSKRYYRGLLHIGGRIAFVLNRETELRSNKNLLVEIKSLKRRFDAMNDTEIDFYQPPQAFVDYVNSALRGKSADVKAYPGPNVRAIQAITWKYRGSDIPPGSSKSTVQYLRDTYGVSGLDPRQPLVVYELEGTGKMQYHLPEVLSVGHTFEDLKKRIPSWQRAQIWDSVHPDCKNQLYKIYEVVMEIHETLRKQMPEIYPKMVEISNESLDVSEMVTEPIELELHFANKHLKIRTPYDVSFYRSYSEKPVKFIRPAPNTKAIVSLKTKTKKIDSFLQALSTEFRLRNDSDLSFDFTSSGANGTKYVNHDLVISIGSEASEENDAEHNEHKQKTQNRFGIAHQHVTLAHADKDSIMALVMQMTLKLGFDPWLIVAPQGIPHIVAIYSYLNPTSKKQAILAMLLNGNGSVMKQFGPFEATNVEEIIKLLISVNEEYRRVLYLVSFDRFSILDRFCNALEKASGNYEYCITQVDDQDQIRFFETWIPKKLPGFGKNAMKVAKPSREAYDTAPQGAILKSDENTFFLLTGRTIEKEGLKRGCPTPIRLSIRLAKGKDWDFDNIASYIMALCMMGRASGHMTRFPSPLYYLQLSAQYQNEFGAPQVEKFRQTIFYI